MYEYTTLQATGANLSELVQQNNQCIGKRPVENKKGEKSINTRKNHISKTGTTILAAKLLKPKVISRPNSSKW
jgi:hypothetical protein